MKKSLLITLLFLNCYAAGEKEVNSQDIVNTWQQFKQGPIYAKLATAGSAINSFSYKYPAVIAGALLLTCKKVPLYTQIFAGCWLAYQIIYSRSTPLGQKEASKK